MTVSSNTAAPRLGRRERYDPKVVAAAFILIAPTIIGLCILNIWPFFDTIRRSLYRTQGLGPEVYIGLKNFEKLFSDSMIGNATVNTLLYMVLTVPVGVLLSLIFASLLNSRIRGRDLYRGIYFLPMVVAPAAVAMVWRWIFNAENGILNISLKAIGIQGPSWLADPNTALVSCAVIGIWSAVGYDLVLILAGLQSISKSYYEAAEIDGANAWQRFWKITIPCMTPIIFYNLLMSLVSSLQVITPALSLTKGGPGTGSYFMCYMLYNQAFKSHKYGYGSAIAVILFLLIAIFTGLLFATSGSWIFYEGDDKE